MDKQQSLTANEYQKLSSRTIVSLGPRDSSFTKHLINSSMGISCESSEVLQCIQRNLFCGKPLDTEHLVDECGDVLWYISYLLTVLNVSLEDCMRLNINKLEKRYEGRIKREY